MAKIHGKDSVVQIEDSGGTLRTMTTDLTNVDAPTNVDAADVAGFGDASHNSVVGMQDTPIGVSGNFNDLGTTGAHAIITSLIRGTGLGGSAGYDFRYLPSGTAVGKPRMRGRVLLTSYQVTSPVGGAVTWTGSLVPALPAGLAWELIS